MYNYYKEMTEIYEHLQDEESKKLFEARISYLFNRSKDQFMKTIEEIYANSDWRSEELEKKMSSVNPNGIIVFGCGHDGEKTKKVLSLCGYDILGFCDSYRWGEKTIDGKKVLSVDEVCNEYKNCLIIIGSSKYAEEMYIELVEKGFPYANILLSKHISKILFAERGKHYFDLFQPQTEEIYIDAGMFDGDTIIDFNQWTNGVYKKIYAFEPIKKVLDQARVRVQKFLDADKEEAMKRINMINGAVWNRDETLYFTDMGSASWQCNNGEIEVQGLKIDSVVDAKDRVTFIKMDIEGSELKALEGAQRTIRNNRPRLAICIYHKPMDIIDLPAYILKLVPEYKFYIRHYGSQIGDEVLYAVL